MAIKYEVRFGVHEYNSGNGRHGPTLQKKNFLSEKEAKELAQKVRKLSMVSGPYLTVASHLDERWDASRDFAKDYVIDGYVETLHGIWKIKSTETRVLQ